MEATDMFLVRHRRLHSHVERLTEGLSDEQIREGVHPPANPLAWLLWHIARTEDAAVNLLICDGPQVLTDDWSDRLQVRRQDAGTGMTMAEVIDLSANVDLPSLLAYWKAVGERTADLIRLIVPSDLDQVVGQERVRRFLEQTVKGQTVTDLQELMRDTTRGHFLVWLPLTHNYEHVGQADLIRGLLGRPGRF
jgi:hypothetical protein